MTKKDYIFNLSNLIKNRVNYHAPINFDGDVDFEKLMAIGMDLTLPVFIMEKPLKKEVIKAFIAAQKEVDFNLVLREKNKSVIGKIKHCYVIKQSEIPSLDKLNINYKTCSKYHLLEKGNYLRLGEVVDKFEQRQFYLQAKGMFNGVFYTVKKYLLSGENIQIEITNTERENRIIELEYNHDLEKGYYTFEKLKKGLRIINLFSNKETYFNANFGKIEEHYSCIDGVENSTYARINFKANILLKPFEKRCFFLNFGSKQFCLNSAAEMDYFFELSQRKNYEIFDTQIESENKLFEQRFNRVLPLKIWKSWLEGGRDIDSENKYLSLKNNILLKSGKKFIFPSNSYKITNILSYDGKSFKKIAMS